MDLFFALSGFLITRMIWTNLRQPYGLRNFYVRRALRILPLYYAALLAAAVTCSLAGSHGMQLRALLVYAGFLQDLSPFVPLSLHYPGPLLLNHLWSLAVEEQFYLFWPFLLLLARTRQAAFHLCLGTFLLSFVFRSIIFAPGVLPWTTAQTWSPFLLTRAGSLALGSALALTPERVNARLGQLAGPAVLLSAALLACTGFMTHSLLLQGRAGFLVVLPAAQIASAAFLVKVRVPGPVRYVMTWSLLRACGRISYGFYVIHILIEPLFDAIGRAIVHTSSGSAYQFVRLLAAFFITVALSWLSYTFFEQPIMRLKRFFTRRTPELAA